jgi:hypothetical protein
MHSRDETVNDPVRESIREFARRLGTENGLYALCFRDISFHHADGVLTMRGRLASFYSKQVLQTLLHGLEGVQGIENRVDVVNPAGRSSVRHL